MDAASSESLVCECGAPQGQHFTAIVEIAESPFGRTKTQYVLVCPGATFRLKGAPPQKRHLKPAKG